MRRSRSLLASALLLASCTDRPGPVAPSFEGATLSDTGTKASVTSLALAPTLDPRSADRVLVDAREALQQATTLVQAIESWGARLDAVSDVRVRLADDVDGAGTSALRFDWHGERKGCQERSPSVGVSLPRPYANRIYIKWKQRLGRSRTGGGLGEINSFVIPTTRCDELDGRFVWTVSRDASSGQRVDLRWRGEDEPRPVLNVKRTDVLAESNQGWDYLPGAHTGEVIVQTLYLQAESKPGAADGALRLFVGDRLLIERTNLAMGSEAFRRMNFPWTMAAPPRSQTEYFWDMVSWVSAATTLTLDGVPTASMSPGGTARLRARVLDGHGADVTTHVSVIWQSSDESVARVSPHGELVAVGAGEAVIVALAEGLRAEARVRVHRSGHYADPAGTASGDGTFASPWDLATALGGGGGRIAAGDTVWLRGGVYSGNFESSLTGAPGRPVVVRQLPGERATIEGQLKVEGAWALYWGFEIRQSNALATNDPTLWAKGPDTRYVNLVIHDAGENGISFRTVAGVNEVYGCIVYNNGNDENLDQGIYAPNDAGEKFITDNVFFNNMASGIQVFGTDDHPQLVNVRVVGNFSFNNSSISRRMSEENITAGSNLITSGLVVAANVLYFTPGGSGQNLRVGLGAAADGSRINRDAVVRDNYVVGGATVFRMENWQTALVQDNTFVGNPLPTPTRIVRMSGPTGGYSWERNLFHADPSAVWNHEGPRTRDLWRALTGLGASDVVAPTLPSETRVFVRPNRYERGRAHIAVVNWGGQGTVSADVSGILRSGDRYEVHNIQDLWGAPVTSGTFDGAPIPLPMLGVDPPRAAGRPGTPPRTAPFFDVFLLTLAERTRAP